MNLYRQTHLGRMAHEITARFHNPLSRWAGAVILIVLLLQQLNSVSLALERHGRIHTALSAFIGKVLSDSFERIAIRRDFEKRIPRDSHIAVNPFPIVQLDDRLTPG